MGVIILIIFFGILCHMLGYFIGYNKGFKECKKYSLTTSNGISGREYVEIYGECPICVDCPHNCPLPLDN